MKFKIGDRVEVTAYGESCMAVVRKPVEAYLVELVDGEYPGDSVVRTVDCIFSEPKDADKTANS